MKEIFSTGILRKHPDTNFALVDAVNLDPHRVRAVAVQVFDWSTGFPVPLLVSPCNTTSCKLIIHPNTSVFFFADISTVEFKYEVRITRSEDRMMVTNVFGVTAEPFTPQEGGTVLQQELVKVSKHDYC
jgi:hypothetical protein